MQHVNKPKFSKYSYCLICICANMGEKTETHWTYQVMLSCCHDNIWDKPTRLDFITDGCTFTDMFWFVFVLSEMNFFSSSWWIETLRILQCIWTDGEHIPSRQWHSHRYSHDNKKDSELKLKYFCHCNSRQPKNYSTLKVCSRQPGALRQVKATRAASCATQIPLICHSCRDYWRDWGGGGGVGGGVDSLLIKSL